MEMQANSGTSALKLWSSHQVAQWLVQNGFEEFKDLFLKHEVSGDILLDLNFKLLGEIGVFLPKDRARILQIIKKVFAPTMPALPKVSMRQSSTSSSSPLSAKNVNINSGKIIIPRYGRYLDSGE
jgi:hypothetical protein